MDLKNDHLLAGPIQTNGASVAIFGVSTCFRQLFLAQVHTMAAAGVMVPWKRIWKDNYQHSTFYYIARGDLETVLEFVANYLVEPFAVHQTTLGGDSRANLDRWLSLMHKGWEACVILNRLRSCCKDMGTLVAPALARGVCAQFAHLRHSEWLVAYGKVKPTRYPTQIEFTNKNSWPHALVRLRAPHDLWFFHPRAGELSPCTVSELDEISSEDSIESEESSESET